MRWTFLAALALLFCQPAAAQKRAVFIDGNELYQECQSGSQMCMGYITGVSDALEALSFSPRTCRPLPVTLEQAVDFAMQTLRDNPTKRHEPAFDIIADAFVATWPC